MHPSVAIAMSYYMAFNPFIGFMVAPYVALEMMRLASSPKA